MPIQRQSEQFSVFDTGTRWERDRPQHDLPRGLAGLVNGMGPRITGGMLNTRTAADSRWVDSKDGSGRKKCKDCGGVGYGSCVCKDCDKCGGSYYGSCDCGGSKREAGWNYPEFDRTDIDDYDHDLDRPDAAELAEMERDREHERRMQPYLKKLDEQDPSRHIPGDHVDPREARLGSGRRPFDRTAACEVCGGELTPLEGSFYHTDPALEGDHDPEPDEGDELHAEEAGQHYDPAAAYDAYKARALDEAYRHGSRRAAAHCAECGQPCKVVSVGDGYEEQYREYPGSDCCHAEVEEDWPGEVYGEPDPDREYDRWKDDQLTGHDWHEGALRPFDRAAAARLAKDDDKGGCTCWEGYERVPGTEPCSEDSCRRESMRLAGAGVDDRDVRSGPLVDSPLYEQDPDDYFGRRPYSGPHCPDCGKPMRWVSGPTCRHGNLLVDAGWLNGRPDHTDVSWQETDDGWQHPVTGCRVRPSNKFPGEWEMVAPTSSKRRPYSIIGHHTDPHAMMASHDRATGYAPRTAATNDDVIRAVRDATGINLGVTDTSGGNYVLDGRLDDGSWIVASDSEGYNWGDMEERTRHEQEDQDDREEGEEPAPGHGWSVGVYPNRNEHGEDTWMTGGDEHPIHDHTDYDARVDDLPRVIQEALRTMPRGRRAALLRRVAQMSYEDAMKHIDETLAAGEPEDHSDYSTDYSEGHREVLNPEVERYEGPPFPGARCDHCDRHYDQPFQVNDIDYGGDYKGKFCDDCLDDLIPSWANRAPQPGEYPVGDHRDHSRHQKPDWEQQGMTAEEWNEAGRPGWVTNNPRTAAADGLDDLTQRKALNLVKGWMARYLGHDEDDVPSGNAAYGSGAGLKLHPSWVGQWQDPITGEMNDYEPRPAILHEGQYGWADEASVDEELVDSLRGIGVGTENHGGYALTLHPYRPLVIPEHVRRREAQMSYDDAMAHIDEVLAGGESHDLHRFPGAEADYARGARLTGAPGPHLLSIERHLVDEDYHDEQLDAGTHLLNPELAHEAHPSEQQAIDRMHEVAQDWGCEVNEYDPDEDSPEPPQPGVRYFKFDGPEEEEVQGYAELRPHADHGHTAAVQDPTAMAPQMPAAGGYLPGHRVGLPWRDDVIRGTVIGLDGDLAAVRWDDGQYSSEEPRNIQLL